MMTTVADNPLRGPRLAIAALLIIAIAALGRAAARGAEPPPADLQLRAKAAVALAEAEAAARRPAAVATAPAPRPSAKLPYAKAYAKATVDQVPLVVLVSCEATVPPDAVVSRAETFAHVTEPSVVVGFPVGDRMYVDATILAKDATAGAVKRAVDAAAKKLESPARSMPPGKEFPPPLDYQIKADPASKPCCVCGPACACEKGKCPGGCPVAAKPQAKATEPDVILTATGRLIRKSGNGYVYADEGKQPKGGEPKAAAPFPVTPAPATTPTTPATAAGGSSTLSSGFYRPAATFTPAARAATPGFTNCAPGQA